MKQTTFEKYEQFLRAMYKYEVITSIKEKARDYEISDKFIFYLLKRGYLKRLAGGSVKLIDCPLGFGHIVSEYKKATERKQPKPEPAGFAYPISVRCEKTDDREKCIKLLESVGYIYKGIKDKNHRSVVTKFGGVAAHISCFVYKNDYDFGRYNIDHFDADLIRDIASVRTGDVWVKGEPFYETYNSRVYSSLPGIMSSVGQKISETTMRRPTIAEICDRHGYELNGMNIVKKSEPKPYATVGVITSKEEVFVPGKVARELSKKADELQSVINAFNATKSLKQHEAEVIKLLKEIESDHGVSYELTKTETIKTKLL